MSFLRSPYDYYWRGSTDDWDEHKNDSMIPGDCNLVNNYNWSDRCYFVQHNDNCLDVDGFINYISVIYCTFNHQLLPLVVTIYLIWLVLLFIGLASSADDFFCPSIEVVSRTLRLSQNIAGVTIMALGNGAPDIFSSLAGVSAQRPELVFGALFGAGVFVTTIVAGAVAISRPFKVMERPFLRDVTFYLMAGFWAFYFFWRGEIRLYDSVGFLCLYVAYILVVIVGRYIHNRIRTSLPYFPQENDVDYSPDSTAETGSSTEQGVLQYPAVTGNPPEVRLIEQPPQASPVASRLQILLRAINPIDREEWKENRWYWKVYFIFRAPLQFLFIITIPKVSYSQPMSNWCKYLSMIQAFVTPLFVVFATSTALDDIGGTELMVYHVAIMVGAVLALVLYFTSRPTSPPRYLPAFAFVGFAVSVIWIYIIANELVSLLKAFGVLFGLSDSILGLTVLAWGNSIGDLIADTAMAKRGQPRAGFSACFGGPLFSLLLGVGLPFTIKIGSRSKLRPLPVSFSYLNLTLSIGLATSLLFSFLLLPCNRFRATRIYGILLLVIYLAFIVSAVAIEVLVDT